MAARKEPRRCRDHQTEDTIERQSMQPVHGRTREHRGRGNRCRASYGCRRAGNGRDVISAITIYGTRGDVDKTEAIWTAMETSRAAMWRERARARHMRKPTRPGGTDTIADSRKRSPADTRSSDSRWNRTVPARNSSPCAATRSTNGLKPTSHSSPTSRNSPRPQRPSQAAYRHGRQDGARQAIGLKETGTAGNWTLEK